jgi:tetratricopeptide (TPR) repeat protein
VRYDKLEETTTQDNTSRTTSSDANNLVRGDEADKHFDKGENNSDLGNYYEAIDDYSNAIKLNPNRHQYYFRRAMAMKHRADELFTYRTDLVNQVIDGYQRAMRDDRFDYYSKFDDGTVPPYCREEILSDLNRAIGLNPSLKYYISRAVFTGSMQDYAEAINLNPQEDKLYFNRGYQRYRDNDKEGAIADYSKAISLNPMEARYYNNRALAKESRNDYEGAKADFDHAYRLSPSIYGDDHPNDTVPWERQFGSFGFIDIK